MSVTLSPPMFLQFFNPNNSGAPAAGYKLFTYIAGTSTKQPTWTDSTQTVQNSNPIILDSNGAAYVWIDPTLVYKFVFTVPNDTDPPTSPIRSEDNITSITASVIGTLIWPRAPIEVSAGVTPSSFAFEPLDPRRYSSVAQWSLVYNAVSSLADSYYGWYRGDHAQHPTLTNAIVGFKTFDDSLLTGTIGWHCTVLGAQALQFNSASTLAGGTNTAIGYASQQHGVDTSGNTSVGPETLNLVTGVSSAHNNCFGYRGCANMTAGTQNNTFGFIVLTNLLTGNNNHCFGESVLQGMTLGNGNHLFGYQAGFNTVTADYMHAFGYQVLTSQTQGTITAITKAASAVVTISTVSVANPFNVNCPVSFEGVGGMTQINSVFGSVTSIGGISGAWTITVSINSSGFSSFTSGGAIFPIGNTAMGYQAGSSLNCGGANTLVGWQTGQVNPVDVGNSCFGYQAGFRLSTGGTLNTAIGYQALTNCLGGLNNSCLGFSAGVAITTGQQNICAGDSSGGGISTASQNVAIGSASMTNLNGAANVAVGFNAGSQGSAQTFTNTASFGNSATPTASNQVTLGNSSIATLRCQQTTITALSDVRFKDVEGPLDLPNGFLDEVQIVVYRWIAGKDLPKGRHVGVIAQQLDELQTKYGVEWLDLVDKSDPDRWEATPGKLLFPLIQRVQRQEKRFADIESRLSLLGV